jgi:hypothetical protein
VRTSSLGSRWNDRDGAGIQNGVVEVLGVVGPVGDDIAGTQITQEFFGVDHIASMARRQHEADGQAKRIDSGMDLGA